MKIKNYRRVLFFTRPLAPPWDEASKNLAFDLATNCQGDFEFEILTPKKENLTSNTVLERRRPTGPSLQMTPIFSSAKFGLRQKFELFFFLFSKNFKSANAVHFLFTLRPLTSWVIKKALSPKIKTIQTIATLSTKLRQNRQQLKKVLFADQIIAQSHHTANQIKKILPEKEVKIIYPGIDLQKYSPAQKDKKLMREIGVKEGDFVAVFAGEFTRLGKINHLIKTYSLLPTNYKLILACRIKSKEDQKEKQRLQEKVKKRGLEKKILFPDFCQDMPGLYNVSDVNLFPVQKMTGKFDIPYVIIEAMACGKPVIISDLPVLQEFIRHNQTGLITPGTNPKKLAEQIKELANNQELTQKISKNAREYVEDNFDINKTARKYEEIYHQL